LNCTGNLYNEWYGCNSVVKTLTAAFYNVGDGMTVSKQTMRRDYDIRKTLVIIKTEK